MKKLIYSLSIAMAFGIAANAATPAQQMQKAMPVAKDAQALQIAPASLEFERISPAKKQVKRRATSAADFVGTYRWSGRNQLQGVVWANEGIMTIDTYSDDPNQLVVTGFCQGADDGLLAEFDAATGRLYLPAQFILFNEYYGQDVWFGNWTVYNGTTEDGQPGYGMMPAPEGKDFYFTLTEDGIQAGDVDADKWDNHLYSDAELADVCCIACCYMPKNDAGYFWMCFGIKGPRMSDFEYIADQWQLLGDADFEDAWLAPLFWAGEKKPNYNVPLYYDKSNPGRYLLYDPYGYGGEEGNPFVYNDINAEPERIGYIIFDITNPECVVFEPLIYSVTIDMSDEDESYLAPIYCFNAEGYYYYVTNADRDEIIVSFENDGNNVSYLSKRENTVYIYNAFFSIGLNTTPLAWNADMEGYIVLTSNYMDGVESVIGEDTDAPAVYYNLQGVRVANPEKGQLLIVKKGNTTTKQIIR